MENQFHRSQSDGHERDEGVLRDILDELDCERTKRAELEAKLRDFTDQQAMELLTGQQSSKGKRASVHPTPAVSRKDWIALQTERDGYKELLDALTADNDAIGAASRATSSSLPLHIVRLLEIMPWHAQAREHAFHVEDIYEWQYHVRGEWTSILRHFPIRFRTLPIMKPHQRHEHSRRIFGGGEQPPKQGVLTDAALTKIIDVTQGYPLPNDEFATWKWVSSWMVDQDPAIQQQKVDSDVKGWSYVQEPDHFLSNTVNLCWSSPTDDDADGVVDAKKPVVTSVKRPFRCRNWKRRRVLVSYPQASQCALAYLELLGENARLAGLSVEKRNDQLADTKTKLTESEEKLLVTQKAVALLEHGQPRKGAENNTDVLVDDEPSASGKGLATGLGGLMDLSSWSSNNKSDGNLTSASTDGEDSVASIKQDDDDPGEDDDRRFDWKHFGRGGLINHIKKSPGRSQHGGDHVRSSTEPLLAMPTLIEAQQTSDSSSK